MIRRIVGFTILAAAVLAPAAVYAQTHPHYLSARTDLRMAQLFMRQPERPNVQLTLKKADVEVSAAIREIDQAAVIDHKDMVDHPPIDTKLEAKDRFVKMVELLRTARADIEREEDNSHAREWRNVAFQHIDAALNAVHRAAVDAHLDREIGNF